MSETSRLVASLFALVRSALTRIDFLALYSAKVVLQNADGTLELQPDDERVPGASKVPFRYGVPGVRAKIKPGARVLLGWENGNPASPYAQTFQQDEGLLELSFAGGVRGVACQGDPVSVTLPPGTTFQGLAAPPVNAFVGTFVAPVTMTGVILLGSAQIKAP
jgi:hypothetical protein